MQYSSLELSQMLSCTHASILERIFKEKIPYLFSPSENQERSVTIDSQTFEQFFGGEVHQTKYSDGSISSAIYNALGIVLFKNNLGSDNNLLGRSPTPKHKPNY